MLVAFSCKSQDTNKIDLAHNILGQHIDKILTPDIKLNPYVSPYGEQNGIKSTKSKEILNFNGVNLYGYVDKDRNDLRNSVNFSFAKKDSLIAMYQIHTYQTKKTEELINALQDLLGEPNFKYYGRTETPNPDEYRAKIWHDKTKQISYMLDISEQDHGKEAWLFIVNNNDPFFYEYSLSLPSFNYWDKYITYKIRFNKPEDYTYSNFVNDRTEKGDELIGILTEYRE